VVNLSVKLDNNPDIQMQVNDAGAETRTNKETRGREVSNDGEYGGELAGRLVWEAYEAGLKVWERENPRPIEEEDGIGDRIEEGSGDRRQQTQTNEEEEKDVYL